MKERRQLIKSSEHSVILSYICEEKQEGGEREREEWGYNRLYQAKQSSVTHVCTTFIAGKRNTSVLPLSSIIETCSKAETHPVSHYVSTNWIRGRGIRYFIRHSLEEEGSLFLPGQFDGMIINDWLQVAGGWMKIIRGCIMNLLMRP